MIKDEFDHFVGRKVTDYGCRLVKKIVVPDDPDAIADALSKLKSLGCDLILTTGGLSVDPDDVTRIGVRRAGGRRAVYGSPVLPGAMFLYAEIGDTPVLGLPACVYYHPTTVFDLVLPRVLAGEVITRRDLADLGHGGLCLDCDACRFPDCPFGR
jgi:molybdopterin biosynthesis enzyme